MQTIHDFFNEAECEEFIRLTEENIPEQDSDEKLPDYYMFKDEKIRVRLWEKLKDLIDLPNYTDGYGDGFVPDSISPHLTILRYRPGYKMGRHTDPGYNVGYDITRPATFMIYLNTVPKGDGGVTHFIDPEVYISPERGKAVLFMGRGWEHEVSELKKGLRYVFVATINYRLNTCKNLTVRKEIFALKKECDNRFCNNDCVKEVVKRLNKLRECYEQN